MFSNKIAIFHAEFLYKLMHERRMTYMEEENEAHTNTHMKKCAWLISKISWMQESGSFEWKTIIKMASNLIIKTRKSKISCRNPPTKWNVLPRFFFSTMSIVHFPTINSKLFPDILKIYIFFFIIWINLWFAYMKE